MSEPPTVVVDFDGTLALHDVGDELCETFADPSWREAGDAWRRGEMSLPEAQRRMWATVTADRAALVARARQVGELRPGADRLFDAAGRGAVELVIASGGFDVYLEPLLGARLAHVAALYCNRLEPGPAGPTLTFPHAELAAGPYAICKAAVVRRHGATVFCGDGSSDRSVAGAVERLFVVRGSLLESYCNERAIEHVAFTTFDEVLSRLPMTPKSSTP